MDFLVPYRPQLLSILRIIAALIFLEHPAAKFLGWPHLSYLTGLVNPLSWPVGIAGIIETIFGLLLLFGLLSRLSAFILSGEMAVAYFYFTIHQGGGSILPIVNSGEDVVMYCFAFLYLAAAGPGPWSIDAAMGREKVALA